MRAGARNSKAELKEAEERYDKAHFHCRTLEEAFLLPGLLDGRCNVTLPKANIVANKKQQVRRYT